MFCPECGSTDKKMVGDICIDCFLKDFQMIEIPERIEVTICKHCNSKLEEGKWSESNLPEEEIVYRALERNIKINDLVENEIIDLEIEQIKGSTAECVVIVYGEVYGTGIEETHDVDVKIIRTACPTCSKIQSGYYESVIQFRADNREIHPEEYEKADKIVARTLNKQYKKDKLAYCPQIAKLKEGHDYYIGSLKTGRKVANALKDEFGGIIKESPRLISEDKSTGKGLYRIWISVRIPEFEIGDFIEYQDKILQVEDIGKNRVVGIDIESNKKHTIPWKDTESIKVIKKAKDVEKAGVISKSPTTIQILDPTDYSVVDLEVKDNLTDINIGDEVDIIKINDYYYLLN
ncbi:MAG: 60S ribosomal export protein NMD3 [Methanobrevibacter sp.]|uniref:60S ribosomal export protein NMD3 n=1 Tax=Methanobrevibacter sp. TaxID=66852 RepID=UPI0026E01CCB|nr:60S ribosomal export protein NMD3 [Methanobrevibacter sp.]MDO5848973.1 60S ribosomal export protein NMD3 [Methanobrevibacter sp.]